MKKLLALALSLGFCLVFIAPAQARPKQGPFTINLRACVDTGVGACLTPAPELDGVELCLQSPGEDLVCIQTEDGEYWQDSQPHGPNWAYLEAVPAGYEFVGATCTTYPAEPYQPCRVHGTRVHFVIKKALALTSSPAVTINFLFRPIGS
jgi:hypothetical protein